jgi:hypothetical protein
VLLPVTASINNPILMFEIGPEDGTVYIDNVVLQKVTSTTPSDWIRFEYNASAATRPILLNDYYITPQGVKYAPGSTIELAPFGGVVLLRDTVTALLPLGLTLKSALINKGVQLGWQYYTPTVAYFEVEKRGVGGAWKTIHKVNAHTVEGASTEYGYLDADVAPSINLYRLKVTNKDGSYSYSNVAQVVNQLSASEVFRIYPNPIVAKSVLTIDLGRAFNGYNNTYQITDLGGKRLRSGRLTQAISAISTEGLPAGSYTVTIDNNISNLLIIK